MPSTTASSNGHARLHQIIAIERGVTADSEVRQKEITRLLTIAGDQSPLTGISRTYRPRREGGVQFPPEHRKVQITVAEILQAANESLTRLFDLKFTREYANCSARADVVVDGVTLIEDVPAGYLLFLENKITELIKGVIDKIPVLNPGEDWHDNQADPSLPDGVYATSPRETTRAEIVRQVQELVPNQVIDGKAFEGKFVPYETQEVVGYWEQVKMSGELPVAVVQAIRARAVKLVEAVKFARESANALEVTDRKAGAQVLRYIFDPVLSD